MGGNHAQVGCVRAPQITPVVVPQVAGVAIVSITGIPRRLYSLFTSAETGPFRPFPRGESVGYGTSPSKNVWLVKDQSHNYTQCTYTIYNTGWRFHRAIISVTVFEVG